MKTTMVLFIIFIRLHRFHGHNLDKHFTYQVQTTVDLQTKERHKLDKKYTKLVLV